MKIAIPSVTSNIVDSTEFFDFFLSNQPLRKPLHLTNRYARILPEAKPIQARAGSTSSGVQMRSGCAAAGATRPPTSVEYNVKEQVIRSRIERSSQRAVSRETLYRQSSQTTVGGRLPAMGIVWLAYPGRSELTHCPADYASFVPTNFPSCRLSTACIGDRLMRVKARLGRGA